MQQRNLGQLKHVSALGLGCMGMTDTTYGRPDPVEAKRTLYKALELGINFFDTADVYGLGDNEILLSELLAKHRDKIIIASKCGILRDRAQLSVRGVSGKPDYIKKACEASLKRLKIECIDLYYLHRMDPHTPIEESMQAMAELVAEGKIKHVGLSEASAGLIRRAHAVHPLTALQTEYSLWSRDVEAEILPTCRELEIGFVPYSPLGRGFFSGKINDVNDLAEDDFRKRLPRFQEENFQENLNLVEELAAIAQQKECTPAQLALAWVLAQGSDIVPIPGTKRVQYLLENVNACEIVLEANDLAAIALALQRFAPLGERNTPEALKGYL